MGLKDWGKLIAKSLLYAGIWWVGLALASLPVAIIRSMPIWNKEITEGIKNGAPWPFWPSLAGIAMWAGVIRFVVLFRRATKLHEWIDNRPRPVAEETRGGLVGKQWNEGVFIAFGRQTKLPIQYTGDRHIVTVGPPGSGKNVMAQTPALLGYHGSALVIDPKGQLTAITALQRQRLGQRVAVINPFNELGFPSVCYNPLGHLDPSVLNFSSDCMEIASGLIEIRGGNSAHFDESARDLVALLIQWVISNPKGMKKDLISVREILGYDTNTRATFFWNMCKEFPDTLIAEGASRYASKDSKEVEDCIQTARVQLGFLRDGGIEKILRPDGKLPEISFADLKRESMTVYLILPTSKLHSHGKFLRLLVGSALGELIKEQVNPPFPVLFMLDEFAQLGHMAIIENAAAIVRDYKLKIWIIVQNLPQLKDTYKDRWESFVSSAGVVQFFTPNDLMTAEYIEKRGGKTLRYRYSESTSSTPVTENYVTTMRTTTGTSTTTEEVASFPAYKVFGAGDRDELLVFPNRSDALEACGIPYYEHDLYKRLADSDPYHLRGADREKWDAQIKNGGTHFHGDIRKSLENEVTRIVNEVEEFKAVKAQEEKPVSPVGLMDPKTIKLAGNIAGGIGIAAGALLGWNLYADLEGQIVNGVLGALCCWPLAANTGRAVWYGGGSLWNRLHKRPRTKADPKAAEAYSYLIGALLGFALSICVLYKMLSARGFPISLFIKHGGWKSAIPFTLLWIVILGWLSGKIGYSVVRGRLKKLERPQN